MDARDLHLEWLESRRLLATYYVANGGVEGNAGTPAAPWPDLQYAADRVEPGDIVRVAAGHYAGFDLSRDGTAFAPIHFLADPGVVIDAPNARTPDGINLEGADHIVIEGFTVVGVDRAGIRSVINEGVTIRGNATHDNGKWGIFTGFSEDLLIEDNDTSGSVVEHGIYVSNSADRPVIRNNRVWDNRASGIQINADASQGGDGIISQALIENNVIYSNGLGGGSAINLDGVQHSTIQNNLLYDNHASGISLFRIDGAQGSRFNTVVNNTVVQPSDGRWAMNIQNGSSDNTLRNNIFLTEHTFRGSLDVSADSLSGFVSDYNVVSNRFTSDGGSSVIGLAAWQAATGLDADSQLATIAAVFVDAASHNYRLADDSPARDAGTSLGAPTTDIAGGARPAGTGWDIGAYEAALSGDLNRDGNIDAADIDHLCQAMAAGSSSSAFDLDGDGDLDPADVRMLVETIIGSLFGDADLDGEVTASADGGQLLASLGDGPGQGWADGDFDCDGEVTASGDGALLLAAL